MHSDVSTKVKKKHFIKHLSFSCSLRLARLIDLCEHRPTEGGTKQPWARPGAVHVWSDRTTWPRPNRTPLVFDSPHRIDSNRLFPALANRPPLNTEKDKKIDIARVVPVNHDNCQKTRLPGQASANLKHSWLAPKIAVLFEMTRDIYFISYYVQDYTVLKNPVPWNLLL